MAVARAVDGDAARLRLSAAFVRAQDFLAKFATEIVLLQKHNLREVVMCSQAKTFAEWKQAQHFVVRDSGFLTVEERDLLEDWEFVLCGTSALESVAFLPRLQKCFKRVDLFLSEHCEALKR